MKHKLSTSSPTIANTVLAAVSSFVMRNLEFIPLCFALQYWFNAGNSWKYWVTIFLVAKRGREIENKVNLESLLKKWCGGFKKVVALHTANSQIDEQ